MKQGTEEWLETRKSHIGASDAPIIMGVCKFRLNDGRLKTPYLLWQEKLGQLDGLCDNYATRFGKEMEPEARAAYEDIKLEPFSPDVVFHPTIPYMMASLDGLNASRNRAVEIKCPKESDHQLAKQGKIPEHYYPQLQHQLEVLGLDEIDYFSYRNGEGVIVTVNRDDKYISKMLKEEENFWKCMGELREPKLIDGDYIERSEKWVEEARELYDLKQLIKTLKEKETNLSKSLVELSENRNARSGDYRYTCNSRIGSVNYTAVELVTGINVNEYRNESSISWRLTKKKTA